MDAMCFGTGTMMRFLKKVDLLEDRPDDVEGRKRNQESVSRKGQGKNKIKAQNNKIQG